MLTFGRTAAVVAALLFSTAVTALSPVSRVGRYLYAADGSRFYIKGIAYQPQGAVSTVTANNPFLEPTSYVDPLADSAGCTRDVTYLKQLGVNTIRVYSVDSTQNHDSCMSTLSAAGIYTIIDLSLPVNGSINRNLPSWTTNLLDLYLGTINAFAKYNNVLAYNVGNEVVIAPNGTAAAAYVKAAARDVKAYLSSKGSSALVGYAAIDASPSWLLPMANYLSCDPSNGNSAVTSIDLFGLNNYEWCGNAPSTTYDAINSEFAAYNVAAYFSEYGCITSTPRVWTEVATIFASPMSNVWSGGLAFSYFPAMSGAGQFGMVSISGNTVTTSTDFTNLQTQYGQIAPPNSPLQASAGAATYPSCPVVDSVWLASSTLPPTPNDASCTCLTADLSCTFNPAPQENSTTVNAVTGTLLDQTCSYLGQSGGNCNDISSNGTIGSYGRVSFCSPQVQLSYAMSLYFESQSRNPTACNFAGNATINSQVPSASTAAKAAIQCLANPSATFVPSAPATNPSSSGTSSSGGVVSLTANLQGFAVVFGFGAVGAIWTFLA